MSKEIAKEINNIRLALLGAGFWAAPDIKNRICITRDKHRKTTQMRDVAASKTNRQIKLTVLPEKTVLELED